VLDGKRSLSEKKQRKDFVEIQAQSFNKDLQKFNQLLSFLIHLNDRHISRTITIGFWIDENLQLII
jgi:hypothetical protein